MRTILILLLAAASAASAPQKFRIEMGEPVLVVEGPAGERRWGRYQFPTVYRTGDGSLLAYVHVEADSAASYGLPQRAYVSTDNGQSWREDREASARPYGLRLPNDEWLLTDTTTALPVDSIQLPAPAGEFASYSTRMTLYRWSELAPDLRRIFFKRYERGEWSQESTVLDDPGGMRYVTGGRFPRIWWGDMETIRDGSIVAVTYPNISADGPPFRVSAACWRSTDRGHTWRLQGRIPYAGDAKADPMAGKRDGFSEPAFTRLRDNSLYLVLRTTDGNGVGPMYHARSRDDGRTWTRPEAFAPNGVLPRLLRLGNGILVLSSGRRGVQLRFSRSGRGDDWSQPTELVPVTSDNLNADSCGYTSLVAVDKDTFVILYSWFQRPGADGKPHKAVLARRVKVTKR